MITLNEYLVQKSSQLENLEVRFSDNWNYVLFLDNDSQQSPTFLSKSENIEVFKNEIYRLKPDIWRSIDKMNKSLLCGVQNNSNLKYTDIGLYPEMFNQLYSHNRFQKAHFYKQLTWNDIKKYLDQK